MSPAPGLVLPFDPWRLLAALLRRWAWILSAGVVMSVLGAAAGYFKFAASFTARAQLMRQESSATFRASELGETFKPRQLSVATLVSVMKSPAVLQRVAEQTQWPARGIGAGLTIAPERNTDLITLSFVTTRGAPTAVRVLNAFGHEVVRFTRDLQGQEAAEMNRLLQKQLAKAEEDLRAVNRELLEFARQTGLVNADKEMDAYLRSLGEMDVRYETTRIEFETMDLKIAAMERALGATNPQAERLQVARERLAELLREVTAANPLVVDQKALIADLEARLKESQNEPLAPPRQGESGLGATFYAELVNLRTQKEVIAAQLEKLQAIRVGLQDKLRGLPEQGMQLARIKARQQSLETAQSLLASRQREAQLYEEHSLGYYRCFEARLDEVEVAGRGKKLGLLAVAGGLLGLGLAIAFVCLVESLDDRIKTAADVKRVTRLPLLAGLPDLGALDAVAQSHWAFRTWLALQAKLATAPQGPVVCGFVSAHGGEGASTWVDLLARAASQRHSPVMAVTNRAPVNGCAVPLDAALARPADVTLGPGRVQWLVAPGDWRWDAARRSQWAAALESWHQTEGLVVLLELTCADQPDTLLLAETLPQLVWVSGRGVARARETGERLQDFRHAGCRFVGAVLNREVPLFPWL